MHRPALVIARHEGEAHGSGRSIPSFHLLNALESCAELFSRYGGHAHAVGFALSEDRVGELRERLESYARLHLKPEDLVPEFVYDAEVPLGALNDGLYEALRKLEPFGMGNPQPVFVSREAELAAPAKLIKEKHLKLRLAPKPNGSEFKRALEALAWRQSARLAAEPLEMGDMVDVAYTLDYNHHPEFGGLQLMLCDWQESGGAFGVFVKQRSLRRFAPLDDKRGCS